MKRKKINGKSNLKAVILSVCIVVISFFLGSLIYLQRENGSGDAHAPFKPLVSRDFWSSATPHRLKRILEHIKQSGLSINQIEDSVGRSPLHYAVLYGKHPRFVSLLVEEGMDSRIKEDESGGTPFHWAVVRKDENVYKIVRELIKVDSQGINEPDDVYGNTALSWAAYFRASSRLIKLLLDSGADPDKKDNAGDIPLISAAKTNIFVKGNNSFIDPETIRLFLDYKTNWIVKNNAGKTALDYMAENRFFRASALFKQISAQYHYKRRLSEKADCDINTYKNYIYTDHSVSCYLANSDLSRLKLSDSNFSNSNLSGSNLSKSNFFNSDFSHSNLSGSNLSNSIFSDANLEGTVFTRSNLRGVDFSGARLEGANLFKANLSSAVLKNAVFKKINLKQAVYNKKTKFPKGFVPRQRGMIKISAMSNEF